MSLEHHSLAKPCRSTPSTSSRKTPTGSRTHRHQLEARACPLSPLNSKKKVTPLRTSSFIAESTPQNLVRGSLSSDQGQSTWTSVPWAALQPTTTEFNWHSTRQQMLEPNGVLNSCLIKKKALSLVKGIHSRLMLRYLRFTYLKAKLKSRSLPSSPCKHLSRNL